MYVFGLTILCATLVSAGCGKKVPPAAASTAPPSPVVEPPPPAPPRSAAPAPVATTSTALSDEELFAQKTLDELNAERPLADVLFDLDEWTIRDDARVILQKNADWMRRWTSTRITLEGHCDDRGTGEYNLALGERRAHAVKEYLASLGVTPDRVLVVSMGEETPVCRDTHEGCWQQNRRGHPIITAK
ncbi:MAG: OmpA family protein [Vicinamibacterales bacterium]